MPGIVLALLAAVLDLLAVALGWHAVRVVTKPLCALILAVIAWRSGGTPRRTLSVGLLFAAAGDEFLLRSDETSFMAGMGAFALMQVAYGWSFWAGGAHFWGRLPIRPLSFTLAVIIALLWAFALVRIVPAAGSMSTAVNVYSVLLLMMGLLAADLAGRKPARSTNIVALGAFIFVCSDLTLASAKFLPGFPLAGRLSDLLVMSTYFAAQILITWGMTASIEA